MDSYRCGTVSHAVSAIQAILHLEMERIDALDLAADFAVSAQIFPKKDSSTGPMQIFGRTGVRAVNFAVDRGLTSYTALGLRTDHRLDENSMGDVHLVWDRLHQDVHANIEIAALNLLCCADEMAGRLEFDSFSASELKLVSPAIIRTRNPLPPMARPHTGITCFIFADEQEYSLMCLLIA